MGSPAFEQLLAALDPDRERAGAQYRDLHRRLVKFFEWERGLRPDEQADEVIDRVVRKIAQGERIENLRAYAHGVAKLLLHEGWKQAAREEEARSQMLRLIKPAAGEPFEALAEGEVEARQQECFDICLNDLTAANRDVILTYYAGEGHTRIEGRRLLARRLGSDLNALRVRAHRIRAQLEQCVWKCVGVDTGRGDA
jgi:DNA-directed RNA polymerase specialized sigma24 family protein